MAQSLTVDFSDPRVRQMLGVESPAARHREVVQLAGDAPDPMGLVSGRGLQSTHRLTAGKQEVVVVFGDMLLTVDLYALPGEPVRAHLICPRCHKQLQIQGDRKHIEFDPRVMNPMRTQVLEAARGRALRAPSIEAARHELAELVAIADFGRLSVEAFECPWEMGDAPHVPGQVHTGASLCRQRLVIDNNRAREP
jgi:hypothetical protein